MQHDDHIWLIFDGEAWAIRKIEGSIFHLWRGYEPHLEYATVEVSGARWAEYCSCAVAMLESHHQ